MATTIFNFPKLGNLRRLADRREAAKHGHTRRRILEALRRLDPDHRRLEAILRDAGRDAHAESLEERALRAMEADGVLDFPMPPLPITDVSGYGTTFCTLHRITTVGNFCSACEAEAAGARVPVSKAATPAPVAHDVRSGEPRLFEIVAMVNRSTVILAVSKKDALDHVSDWEQTWESSSDFIGISDVEVIDVRLLRASRDNWQAEAHETTKEAQKAIASASVQSVAPDRSEGFLYCAEHGTVIKDAGMQFCPACEVQAMDDNNPDPDPGRLVTDGAEGGVR